MICCKICCKRRQNERRRFMENAVTVKNLTKKYEGFTLDHISFTIPTGSVVGFVGENGAGKSTTILAILGIISADEGEVEMLGHPVTTGKNRSGSLEGKGQFPDESWREHIGVVFDECNFSAELNLKYISRIMKNIYHTWDEDRFMKYIKKFELPMNKKVKELSKGMKMKLSIAVALSHDSRLLILDEATSGLDPVIRNEILDIFREFIEDGEHTVFISSHITSDIEKIADYVMLIHKGKLLFEENKDELLYNYGIVRCSRKQAELIPRELIMGSEGNEYGVSVLIKDRNKLMESTFPKEAEMAGQSPIALDRVSIEDVLLYFVKSADMIRKDV